MSPLLRQEESSKERGDMEITDETHGEGLVPDQEKEDLEIAQRIGTTGTEGLVQDLEIEGLIPMIE